jgi:WD40 repeat protein
LLEFVSRIQGNRVLSQELSELRIKRPYKIIGSIRPFDPALARFEGHTSTVTGVAAVAWPGLDHPVIVTAGLDGTARVWDPRDPGRELARFEGHTEGVWGVAAVAWRGLDHPVIVTAGLDGTARVWDPRDPGRELARFPLFGEGHSALGLNQTTLAFTSSRGFLVFKSTVDESFTNK